MEELERKFADHAWDSLLHVSLVAQLYNILLDHRLISKEEIRLIAEKATRAF